MCLEQLKTDMQHSRRAAYAQSTHQNLLVQWRSFLLFCLHYELRPLPAETETVALFAQFLSRSFKTVDSIFNYVSGVRIMHLYVGASPPNLSDFSFKLVLSGLRRLKPHRVSQAAPITPQILVKMYPHICQDPEGPTIWALFLVAFYLFLRKSNLVPLTPTTFDPARQLSRGDVIIGENAVLVKIRWSKTIQFGQRVLKLPLLSVLGSVLCPVSAIKAMLESVPTVKGGEPLFQIVDRGVRVPVTYLKYQFYVKKFADLVGEPAHRYSSHSFRRGGRILRFSLWCPKCAG